MAEQDNELAQLLAEISSLEKRLGIRGVSFAQQKRGVAIPAVRAARYVRDFIVRAESFVHQREKLAGPFPCSCKIS